MAIAGSALALPAVTELFVGSFVQYAQDNAAGLLRLTVQHIDLITLAMGIAVPVGLVLGVLITFDERVATVVIWLAGIMLTVPSIALFGLLIPIFGIGDPPVIIALVLYSQLPIIRNTYVGIKQVDPAAAEAGRGLGMTRWERLRMVQLPIALPVIMAGVRNAVVILIGIAAIGAYIGAGGLGNPIFAGITQAQTPQIVVSTLVLSGLALAVDYGFGQIERWLRIRKGEDVEPTSPVRLLSKLPGL